MTFETGLRRTGRSSSPPSWGTSGRRTRTGTRTSEDDILNFLMGRPRTRTARTSTSCGGLVRNAIWHWGNRKLELSKSDSLLAYLSRTLLSPYKVWGTRKTFWESRLHGRFRSGNIPMLLIHYRIHVQIKADACLNQKVSLSLFYLSEKAVFLTGSSNRRQRGDKKLVLWKNCADEFLKEYSTL